ncbi:hypothetical protein L198_04856 [Cryptococcus wingfieldii CBS 7118]|uniref:Uncharacterized protein n=1 Tax=Cryptococcus wingfieldii CBS 7118 TaxID=1295528 RepID=A0A1E3J1L0_9TREE|nr:hypothetical protein L198_04856 [Cryptococcus wingfieldii CBS 7118]ODN94714.1 hypothetical protein L198_04856 [Cryptococcus wingfieldii CBS 7118]
MSLNSVVAKLVRAASGISQDISDADLDAHVAQLLAQEAKAKESKWSELGLSGLLGNSMLAGRDEPDPSLPKPNKRFLASIIRTVDGHNSALLRSQAEGARQARQERMPDPPPVRGQGSSRRGGAGPAGRLFGGAMRDMSRNEPKREDKGSRRAREERGHGREEREERNDRSARSDRNKGKERERDERSPRSDDYHREDRRRSQRQDEDEDRYHSRRDRRDREEHRHRRHHEEERDRERDRDRRRSRNEEYRHRHDSSDEDRPRKSRRSHSPEDRSHPRSRHHDSGSTSLPSKSSKPAHHQSSTPLPPKDAPPPRPRSPSRSPSPSPPPPPKSKMDRYFEESYDPRLDFPTTVASEGIVQDVGWDNMLAKRRQSPSLSDDESAPPPGILPRKRARSPDTALAKLERRERRAERKKRKDRRRDDSESEDEVERAWRKEKMVREKEAKGDEEGDLGGYEYVKKGGTRAWDVGK